MQAKPFPALTAELSKLARRQLGLSQKDVIEGTGLPSYKLKQWEARGLDINVSDLRTLRDFYVSAADEKGLSFDEIEAGFYAPKPTQTGDDSPNGAVSRCGFLVSPKLSPEVVDQLMGDMETSDERIAELVKTGVKSGVFGGMTAETETMVQELFGHLAANHLRFRCLQGRNIIAATRDEAETVGDHLGQWVQNKGLAHVAASASSATVEQE
nr:hypothetical protein [uncultured Roseateles sp.]